MPFYKRRSENEFVLRERKCIHRDFRYTKQHEWIKVEGSTATVGITEYAQEQLGDVVFAELPKVGVKLDAGQSFGTVESVKAVSEIFMPVSGEIAEINSSLVDTPENINKDPHDSAWLVKIKLSDPSEVAKFMDAKAYEAYVATSIPATVPRYSPCWFSSSRGPAANGESARSTQRASRRSAPVTSTNVTDAFQR